MEINCPALALSYMLSKNRLRGIAVKKSTLYRYTHG